MPIYRPLITDIISGLDQSLVKESSASLDIAFNIESYPQIIYVKSKFKFAFESKFMQSPSRFFNAIKNRINSNYLERHIPILFAFISPERALVGRFSAHVIQCHPTLMN